MKIGILAVQGAFIEHKNMLESLGIECLELRKKTDITENHLDALVFPGGESTVQGKLLHELEMFDLLKNMIEAGIPVMATCAGLILLSQQISGEKTVHLGTLPVRVKRNAYGRQVGSFIKSNTFKGLGDFDMTFIRAPYIEEIKNPQVQVLSVLEKRIVAVRYKNQLAMAFHPEIGRDNRIHKLFISMI